MAQGQRSQADLAHNINWLELMASRHMLSRTDNVGTKAYINRQGGTQSKALMKEAKRLCLWTEKLHLSLRAEHFAGAINVQADWFIRATIDHAEWLLHPDLFQKLTES